MSRKRSTSPGLPLEITPTNETPNGKTTPDARHETARNYKHDDYEYN